MVLGAIVIFIVAMYVVNYFKDKKTELIPAISTETSAQEYTVVKGDTLWSIAENSFGSGYNWVDIKKANNLKSDQIEVGQKLTIPEVSTKQPTATNKVETGSNLTQITGTSYVVEKGDTLWSISVRAYGDGYQWVNLASENDLKNPNIIHVGNVLVLPR